MTGLANHALPGWHMTWLGQSDASPGSGGRASKEDRDSSSGSRGGPEVVALEEVTSSSWSVRLRGSRVLPAPWLPRLRSKKICFFSSCRVQWSPGPVLSPAIQSSPVGTWVFSRSLWVTVTQLWILSVTCFVPGALLAAAAGGRERSPAALAGTARGQVDHKLQTKELPSERGGCAPRGPGAWQRPPVRDPNEEKSQFLPPSTYEAILSVS